MPSYSPEDEEEIEREDAAMRKEAERLGLGCERCTSLVWIPYNRIQLPWCKAFEPCPEDALIEDVQDPQCRYESFSPTREGWERVEHERI